MSKNPGRHSEIIKNGIVYRKTKGSCWTFAKRDADLPKELSAQINSARLSFAVTEDVVKKFLPAVKHDYVVVHPVGEERSQN